MAARVETGTADFASTITSMNSFTLTATADAAEVNLRQGVVGGTIKFVVKAPIATTTHLKFPDGVETDNDTVWFVDLVAGTTPQMTITGR